jgi:hypothetical protein
LDQGYFSGIRAFFLPAYEEVLSHDPMISGIGAKYPEGQGHIGDEYIQYCRGHSRDRRVRNKRDYTPFHTQLDIEPELEDRDHISSDIEAEKERTMGTGVRHQRVGGKASRHILTVHRPS